MAERPKLLYVIINDEAKQHDQQQQHQSDGGGGGEEEQQSTTRKFPPPRYTRSVLQSTLQLMGCKPRHAFKISDRVFDVLSRNEGCPGKKAEIRRHHSETAALSRVYHEAIEKEQERGGGGERSLYCTTADDDKDQDDRMAGNYKSGNDRGTVTVTREKFLDFVCEALAEYQYVGPNQRADLMLACMVREKKISVTVLLCGTSGCGKSTLSSLLASRLGITTVVSTDSLRHMMRSFVSEKENPLLWASTYHAGECLDPYAIAEAKIKKKEAKMAKVPPIRNSSFEGRSLPVLTGSSSSGGSSGSSMVVAPEGLLTIPAEAKDEGDVHENENEQTEGVSNVSSLQIAGIEVGGTDVMMGSKTMVVQGFKAQSEMVIDSLDRLITGWEQKNESVVVEGVHLSLNFVMGLMKKHPSIVPFMVYISNEGKHLERFAVRAKYMTLDPAKNKYVKYIRNIRTIQEYLCKRADKHLVPKVNNTNVDKSIALIHATIFSCLRRRMGGEPLCDQATNTVKVVDQEYRSQYAASSLGSKGMYQLIQRRGSSRHLMALMNTDGSVAKAWPIESDGNSKANASGSSNSNESGKRTPLYGPLAIGKSEPVHLQFGNFGLSAWLDNTGAASYATSHNGSGDGQSSRGELELNSSHPGSSSCSSSPKHGEGGDKELTDEVVVSVSDEEPDEEEPTEVDSDGEASGMEEHIDDDDAGSVDDQSERSDDDGVDYESGRQPDDGSGLDDIREDRGNGQDHRPRDGGDELSSLPGRTGEKIQVRRGTQGHRLYRGRPVTDGKESSESTASDNRSHNRSKSCPKLEFSPPFSKGEQRRTNPEGRTRISSVALVPVRCVVHGK